MELDKGRLYVTLGKYITIAAFELVAETAQNHCTSCGLSPKAETQRDLQVSQVRLWLDNLLDSPSSFHRCCLTGKVALSDGTRSGSASDPIKHKAPQWLCMRFLFWGFVCLFVYSSIESFIHWFIVFQHSPLVTGMFGFLGGLVEQVNLAPGNWPVHIIRFQGTGVSTWKSSVFCYQLRSTL